LPKLRFEARLAKEESRSPVIILSLLVLFELPWGCRTLVALVPLVPKMLLNAFSFVNWSGFPSLPSQPGQFTNENAFNNIFGTNGTSATNVLQPQGSSNNTSKDKMITGDLDSSLANLASNLNFGNQNRGGLVPQARGPPLGGLNAMQSQPMAHPFM
jgi:hypothetical protein